MLLFGSKSKVNQLDAPVLAEKDVLTFDIPMKYALIFEIFQSWQYLSKNCRCEFLWQRSILIDVVEKLPIGTVLHEYVYFLIIF